MVIRKRYVFNVTLHEFYIRISKFGRIFPCFEDHFRGEIQSYYFAFGSSFISGNKTIIIGSGAKIKNDISFLDPGKFRWQATSQAKISIRIVSFQLLVVFTHNVEHFFWFASTTTCRSFLVL